MFNMDVFFTWRTSLAGFVVYTILLAIVGIILLIRAILKCIMKWSLNKFQNYTEEYGIMVD